MGSNQVKAEKQVWIMYLQSKNSQRGIFFNIDKLSDHKWALGAWIKYDPAYHHQNKWRFYIESFFGPFQMQLSIYRYNGTE